MLTSADAQPAVLVAGVGNIFLRDDGWGSEVARRLMQEPSADGVHVVDYGIGGIHLTYDLLDGVGLLVLVDSLPRDVEPGTLTVLEVDPDSLPQTRVDSHAMDPAALLANVSALGGELPRTLVVGCEPEDVSDGMGLTPRVRATIDDGIRLVHEVVAEHHPQPRHRGPRDRGRPRLAEGAMMDAVALLEQQHREVDDLAEEFLGLGSEAVDRKREIARIAIEQLSIHATLEEMAFYPAVKDAMPDLADQIDAHRQDHQKVKDLAQQLLGMDPEDPRFVTTIIQLVGEVREHVEEEEGELFPKVREAFTAEELGELGATMEELQDDAARRPHPWAPDQPPLNTLAVPIASRLDKLRSRVRDRIGKKTI